MSKLVEKFSNKIIMMEETNQWVTARIYMVLSILCLTVTQVLVKSSTIPVPILLQIRGVLMVIISTFSPKYKFHISDPKDRKIMILQSFLCSVSVIGVLISQRYLPLSESIVLSTTNVIWAQFAAYYILNEPLKPSTFWICFVSILGVVIITRPPFIFETDASQSFDDDHAFWCFMVLLCSLLLGVAFVMIKLLGFRVSANTKLFYFNLMVALQSGEFIVQNEISSEGLYTLQNLMILFLLTFSSYWCHLLQIKAMGMVSYAKLAPYFFTNVLSSLFLEVVFLKIYPSLMTIFGFLLIMISLLKATLAKE